MIGIRMIKRAALVESIEFSGIGLVTYLAHDLEKSIVCAVDDEASHDRKYLGAPIVLQLRRRTGNAYSLWAVPTGTTRRFSL